ncbi:MAG: Oxygen regulatory protein NreC [Bryobacteraceae bacterium]|nr:Oxygen regulatory protein NreC [Bryobacteraceae bacterium]MCC6340989.1 response regulator transcription factor [Bryobacterales bacterium]
MSKIRVLVADDHGVVRKGLRFLIERQDDMEIVAEAADGREAVRLAEELNPKIVVMDIGMPRLNGIEAAAQIVRRNPDTAVIILSMHAEGSYLVRALTAGVKGYLLKGTADEDLTRAVRAVAQGKSFFSPTIAQMLAEDYTRHLQQKGLQDSYDLLTEREREVLQLLAEGKSNKDAASLLNVSPYTVETHRTHIMQKLGLHNTAELVLYAVRKKIIQ